MADPKPSDLFIGVTELFGVLAPGAALVYLLQPLATPYVPLQLRPPDGPERWIVFLVLSYALGQMLFASASALDKRLYDDWYLPRHQPAHRHAVKLVAEGGLEALCDDIEASSTLYGRVASIVRDDAAGTNRYDWCLSYIRIQSAAAALEVDRYQANSKLFRSLAVVLLVAAVVAAAQHAWLVATISILMVPLFIRRYCSLRWDATKRLYEYYLLLHKYPPKKPEAQSAA